MINKSIVFINQSPNDLLCDIAQEYKNIGYNCTLICGNRITGDEVFDKVITFTSYDRSSALSRLQTWWKFYKEAKLWLKENTSSFDELFLVSNPPLLFYLPHFHSPLQSKKLHALVYDLYPDILHKMFSSALTWLPGIILAGLNKKSLKLFANIYTPSETLSKTVRAYTTNKVTTVYNWSDFSKIAIVPSGANRFLKENNLLDKFIVLYSGNLGRTHDVKTMLACSRLTVNKPEIAYVFIGAGEGMEEIKKMIADGSKNIYCFNWQDETMFSYSISCGDLAWVGYKKGFEDFSIPSKLPYYLASGTPVIMIGETGSELAMLLTNNKIGYAVTNDDASTLASIITNAVKNKDVAMKERCRNFAATYFSKANAKKFIS